MEVVTVSIPMKTFITGKGKNCTSRQKVNGELVSTWIVQHGGEQKVLSKIKELIRSPISIYDMCKEFNVQFATMSKYLIKHLTTQEFEAFQQLKKAAHSLNASRASKGRPSKLKGKTYLQIHGTSAPRNGFKRGNANPNYTRSKFIGLRVPNARGKMFRSSYEVQFSDALDARGIDYEYEHRYTLLNGKLKIVDFVIGNILIEITGYASEKWREDFDVKIQLLSRSYPTMKVLILSKNDSWKGGQLEALSKHKSNQISVLDLNNTQLVVDYIIANR